jgi:hypothetical protein
MEYAILATAGLSWWGWCYWKRCLRIRQIERDGAYWERVRRECPTCGMRRNTATCDTTSQSG